MGTLAYQHLGIGLAICVTGISFLLSAITMASIPPDRIIDAGKTSIRPSLFREMADGVRYVVSRKVLLWLNLCFTAVGFGVGLIAPLGIFLITERLGFIRAGFAMDGDPLWFGGNYRRDGDVWLGKKNISAAPTKAWAPRKCRRRFCIRHLYHLMAYDDGPVSHRSFSAGYLYWE